MNINDLVFEDTFKLQLLDTRGEPFDGAFITVYGPDTKEQQRAYTKQRNALLKAGDDEDKQIAINVSFLTDCTKSVEGIYLEKDGKDTEATLKDLPALLEASISLRAQVVGAITNDINFMKG